MIYTIDSVRSILKNKLTHYLFINSQHNNKNLYCINFQIVVSREHDSCQINEVLGFSQGYEQTKNVVSTLNECMFLHQRHCPFFACLSSTRVFLIGHFIYALLLVNLCRDYFKRLINWS